MNTMKKNRCIDVLLIFCLLWLGCGGENIPPESARVYKVMQDKANELGSLEAAVKLDPSAAIKGKTAIVVHWHDSIVDKPEDYRIEGYTQYFDGIAKAKVLDPWGLTPETVPTTPSEIETLVRISCGKGDRIGTFPAERRAPVPAYRRDCLVDIIDYKTKTVVSRETFFSSEIDPHTRVLPIDQEVVASPPYEDIKSYVKNFKRE
ncbi:MAG: hypothetical protein JFAIHJKO_01000 [Pyrinomonadaceae bacterium]|nr:hypothetical protein [Pyrinomonadaceae bacterium]